MNSITASVTASVNTAAPDCGASRSRHSGPMPISAQRLSGSRDFGTVAFGTEGGLFHQAGIPTVVCGPGSMEQGHKPDEFVSQQQLDGCDAMLMRLADWLQRDN